MVRGKQEVYIFTHEDAILMKICSGGLNISMVGFLYHPLSEFFIHKEYRVFRILLCSDTHFAPHWIFVAK